FMRTGAGWEMGGATVVPRRGTPARSDGTDRAAAVRVGAGDRPRRIRIADAVRAGSGKPQAGRTRVGRGHELVLVQALFLVQVQLAVHLGLGDLAAREALPVEVAGTEAALELLGHRQCVEPVIGTAG